MSDNTGIPENQRGGTAKQLLGSAVVFCYMSALLGSLDARGVKYGNAAVPLGVEPNNLEQGRVKKITIDAAVTLPGEDAPTFERMAKIMKQGCLIAGSPHEGVEMAYNLHPEYKD